MAKHPPIDDRIQLPFERELHNRLQQGTKRIQFIIGPRQVGKTTGVLSVVERLKTPHHIVSVEDPVHTSHWLKEQWYYARTLGKNVVLVVDEVQKIPSWSSTIKALYDEQVRQKDQRFSCVLLGSSSLDLNEGMNESLTGRFEVLEVPHWGIELSQKLHPTMTLESFLRYGGYPGSYEYLSKPRRWKDYIKKSIIQTVIGKDIIQMNHVKKPALFYQMVEILANYPAQDVSYTKILGQLQESGNVEIVKHYLRLLQQSYLFYPLEKFSPKKVLQKASSPKIIPMAPALIEGLAPTVDFGRRFEAYVGSQLIRFGGDTFYWRDGQYEVDFIYVNQNGKTFAVEVKSGKKKVAASLSHFLDKNKSVIPLIIDTKNLSKLSSLVEEDDGSTS